MKVFSIRHCRLLALVAPATIACAVPSGDDVADDMASNVHAQAHIQRMLGATAASASITVAAPTGTNELRYYGGKVIERPRVYSVNWNAHVDARIRQRLAGFYAAVVDSPYTQWLTAYNTFPVTPVDGGANSNQRFGRGSFGGEITLTPQNTAALVGNGEVRQEISHQIDIGVLPEPTDDTYYAINFPTDVTVGLDSLRSCREFCAYHNSFSRSGHNVYYAVVPSQAPGSACNHGCGGASNFLDNVTAAAGHELTEAMTDAQAGMGAPGARPNAWFHPSTDGTSEIADICDNVQSPQATFVGADGATYTVEKLYDNQTGTCLVSKPPPAKIWRSTGAPCTGGGCPGWQLLDNNAASVRIASSASALYQLHSDGSIWRFTGSSCSGSSCPGWQRLDNNPVTVGIFADGSQLYQLHSDGNVFRFTGVACSGASCPGWELLADNAETMNLVAGGGQLYALQTNGDIWRFTGTPCSGTTCPGWELINHDSATVAFAVDGSTLYQLQSNGFLLRYTGVACSGGSCPGWQLLANNAQTVGLAAGGGQLYALLDSGEIWKFTGTPCSGNVCPGWQLLDNNRAAMAIVTDGPQLLQLQDTGDIWRYTGTPCSGGSCPGWQLLDSNAATGRLAAFGTGGYQLHGVRTSMRRQRVCYDCRP